MRFVLQSTKLRRRFPYRVLHGRLATPRVEPAPGLCQVPDPREAAPPDGAGGGRRRTPLAQGPPRLARVACGIPGGLTVSRGRDDSRTERPEPAGLAGS